MSADLRVVADPQIPPWVLRYVFDFGRPRPDLPCPVCGDALDDFLDGRLISFAVKDGQRLCEGCLCEEIPEPLIDVTEFVGSVLGAATDHAELSVENRVAVLLSSIALSEWLARALRKALP